MLLDTDETGLVDLDAFVSGPVGLGWGLDGGGPAN